MGTNKDRVAILLATYNGGQYLAEQLDSLFSQSYNDFTIYIHDDGSKDDTLKIIEAYKQRYNQIELLDFPVGCGAKESFLTLLQKVDADYYFFCDQDDVWKPNKVELSLAEMKKQEAKVGKDKPVLVYSDLQVVDSNLQTISDSFWQMMLIRPEKLRTFNQLGGSYLVTGCTMLINQSARQCTVFPATKATMHDVWITLCVAKNHGVIHAINTPLILYRQHGNNTLGAIDGVSETKLSNKLHNIKRVYRENVATYRMLSALQYGSVFKYLFYKIYCRYSIRNSFSEK